MGFRGSVTEVQPPRGDGTSVAVASDLRIFPDRGSEIFADLATQALGRRWDTGKGEDSRSSRCGRRAGRRSSCQSTPPGSTCARARADKAARRESVSRAREGGFASSTRVVSHPETAASMAAILIKFVAGGL